MLDDSQKRVSEPRLVTFSKEIDLESVNRKSSAELDNNEPENQNSSHINLMKITPTIKEEETKK